MATAKRLENLCLLKTYVEKLLSDFCSVHNIVLYFYAATDAVIDVAAVSSSSSSSTVAVIVLFSGFPRSWKVLENGFGPGKSWKFECKVLKSPGIF